jgi:hypothetical protein
MHEVRRNGNMFKPKGMINRKPALLKAIAFIVSRYRREIEL